MTDHAAKQWTDEEPALSRQLRALADHGTAIAEPLPLPAQRTTGPSREHGRRPSGARVATVGLLTAAVLAVPVAISGFVPGLPFSGDSVTALGLPATQGPLCDTLSDTPAPAGDRVVRQAKTGPLTLAPTQEDPELPAAEVKRRLLASGTTFLPGTQLRYGAVDGTVTWVVTTCGPAADGSNQAELVTADGQGRVTGRTSTPIEAAAPHRYEAVPRRPDGGTPMSVDAVTSDAQVVAAESDSPDGMRTVVYRTQDGEVCAIAVSGSPAADTPSGVCASTLPEDDGEFGVGAAWSDADDAVLVTGFAPVGTAWLSIQQANQPTRDVLLRTADDEYGGRAGFSVVLERDRSTVLIGYDETGQETGRIVQEFDRR